MNKLKIIYSDTLLSILGLVASFASAYVITLKGNIGIFGQWAVISAIIPMVSVLVFDIDQIFLNKGVHTSENRNLKNYVIFKLLNLKFCIILFLFVSIPFWQKYDISVISMILVAFALSYMNGAISTVLFYHEEIREHIYLPTITTLTQNLSMIIILQFLDPSLIVFSIILLISNSINSIYLFTGARSLFKKIEINWGVFDADWILENLKAATFLTLFKWAGAQKFNTCITLLSTVMGSEVAGIFTAILKLPNLFLVFLGKLYQPFIVDFIKHQDDLATLLNDVIGKIILYSSVTSIFIAVAITQFYQEVVILIFNLEFTLTAIQKTSVILIVCSYMIAGIGPAISTVKIPKPHFLFLIVVLDYFPISYLLLTDDVSFDLFLVAYGISAFLIVLIHVIIHVIYNAIVLRKLLLYLIGLPIVLIGFLYNPVIIILMVIVMLMADHLFLKRVRP